MAARFGLFGGSFDPIHFGHLIGARTIAERLNLDRVVLIPSARPPHKQGREVTEARHRLEMARRAVAGDPMFEVDDLELHRQGPSYTFDTVTEYRRRGGADAELFWLIGADSLPELPTWYRIAELVGIVHIVTITRPGWLPPDPSQLEKAVGQAAAAQLLRGCEPTPGIDISATTIRTRVRENRPIRYLVPEPVESYIREHSLYL